MENCARSWKQRPGFFIGRMSVCGACELTVAAAGVRCGIVVRLFSIVTNNGRDAVQRDAGFAAFQPAVSGRVVAA
jgi:hypothetical protein